MVNWGGFDSLPFLYNNEVKMIEKVTDKDGRKFEVHYDIFGSVTKQVEIFDKAEEPAKPNKPVKPLNKRGR